MVSGTFIIIATAAGLVLLFIWLVYRIIEYKKKAREIDERAREISKYNPPSPVKKARTSPDPSVLEAPSVGLMVVMHREGISPTRGMFVSAVEKGRSGLLITPDDPRGLPIDPSVRKIWLNRSSVKGELDNTVVVNPTNLSGALDEIGTYASETQRSMVILIDRFEDVITANDMARVMRFLNMLRERSAKDRMTILVPVNYRAIPQRVRNQLMEAFETVVV